MGKYTKEGRVRYLVLVNPEEAARRVVQAWERVVREYLPELQEAYREGITGFAVDREKQEEVVEALRDYYARIVPRISEEFKREIAAELSAYAAEKARVLVEYYGGR